MQPDYSIIRPTSCCGIRELYTISHRTPEEVIFSVADFYFNPEVSRNKGAYYIFSDNTGREGDYGDRLRQYIEDNNLGEVFSTGYNNNPNSGNELKAYLWTLDVGGLNNWLVANEERLLRPPIDYQALLREKELAVGSAVRFPNTVNRWTVTRVSREGWELTRGDEIRNITSVDEINSLIKSRRVTNN